MGERRFRAHMILPIATGVIIAALVVRWVVSQPPASLARHNSIMVLMPYRHAGSWVFDDPSANLKQEAFIAGIPQMIDAMVADIAAADQGFRMLFSAQPFPGWTHKLDWRRGDGGGNWYYCEEIDAEGWLCASLLKYFGEPPPNIYVKAEPLGEG